MATSWMKSKEAKIKRDGLARSRGICPTFSKTERDHLDASRINTAKGFWVVALDKTPRGLPRSYGPFPDMESATAFGRGMITPARKGARPMADDFKVQERGTTPPKPKGVIPCDLEAARTEHAAKLQAQRELSRATREALGHRTAWAK